MVTEPTDFHDFDADDALEEVDLDGVDFSALAELQQKMNQVNSIEDPTEQKNAAKALVRQLNGEE